MECLNSRGVLFRLIVTCSVFLFHAYCMTPFGCSLGAKSAAGTYNLCWCPSWDRFSEWEEDGIFQSPQNIPSISTNIKSMNQYLLLISINVSILSIYLEYNSVRAGLAGDQRATRGWLWYHALSDSWMLGHWLGVRGLKIIEKWTQNHIRLHSLRWTYFFQIQDFKDMELVWASDRKSMIRQWTSIVCIFSEKLCRF